ncbi:PepSY-associated TM helix domain-containing protein [Curvivirga aplysinae]|uniref:PepSY-associated TM helix domain-containing protein n=1 Tax=Curvivirga aplysinae TaxID=2529852 RepID=UPI0012BBFBBE|nr:PepSY domain-containing protein [Curvivirga aplysinae]MTI09050.1 PepSY domain-containing protein [Curvivirga aplysinae]
MNNQTNVASYEDATNDDLSTKFYRAVWRWHFYAGLYVIPFMLMLAITGLLMMYYNVFETRFGVKPSVEVSGEMLSPNRHYEAAQAVYPNGQITRYIPPADATSAAYVEVVTESHGEDHGGHGGAGHVLSIDPYTNQVLGDVVKDDTLYYLANDIHGTLLIGDLGDRLIEIAASLGIVLIVTGLYMWWPRQGSNFRQVLLPNFSAKGRALWKDLHVTSGFYISVILMFFLLSGLAWAGVWGGKFVQPWSSFPAEKWGMEVPLSDDVHASMSHGALEEVPWGLEQTKMPISGSDAGITGVAEGYSIDLSSITDLAYRIGFGPKFRINLPESETGVYTITADAWDSDTTDPTADRTVHIDQYTGKILGEVGYADYSLMAKTMAVGTALHQGDMGLWNIILNVVFCLTVIFLCVSGIVMWWKRRPSKVGRLMAPPMPNNVPLWKGAVAMILLLSMAFPLVGVSLIIVLFMDLIIFQNIKPLKRILQ